MTTAYDPSGVPRPRRTPMDPLLSLPDHPSGEWSAAPRVSPRDLPPAMPQIGHPRPANLDGDPFLASPFGAARYPVVAEPASEPAVLNGRGRNRLATIMLVLVLLVVAGWQAWRLDRVDNRLGGRFCKGQGLVRKEHPHLRLILVLDANPNVAR